LKKRTKKLLQIAGITALADLNRPPAALSKSFLLLFFKKEVLPALSPKLRYWPRWQPWTSMRWLEHLSANRTS
jgi:hypothetical protein